MSRKMSAHTHNKRVNTKTAATNVTIPTIKNATKYSLIIDTRERAIFPYRDTEMAGVDIIIKQINVGDYAITKTRYDENGVAISQKLMTIIERKSFEDFAASIKDGRYDNKAGLIAACAKSGCSPLYIVEGMAFPDPNRCFGNIPFKYIQSAIMHMMVRDKIQFIYTRDVQHTATTLTALVRSMSTLEEFNDVVSDVETMQLTKQPTAQLMEQLNEQQTEQLTKQPTEQQTEQTTYKEICDKIAAQIEAISATVHNLNANIAKQLLNLPNQSLNLPNDSNKNIPNVPTVVSGKDEIKQAEEINEIPDVLMEKTPRDDIMILRTMWACFPGIAVVSADHFMHICSIGDLIHRRYTRAQIEDFKTAHGKKVNSRVVNGLARIDKHMEARLLTCIPGISKATAEMIVREKSLSTLLTYGKEGLAMMTLEPLLAKNKIAATATAKPKQRKLGDANAERIIKFFNLKI